MPAESEDLVTDVVIACVVGGLLFVTTFAYIVCWRHINDASELPNLRALIKCQKIISGCFVLLLIPLLWGAAGDTHPVITPMTSYGNGSSWNFGWGRPVGHFSFAFVGSFVEFHPASRVVCVIGMMQAVFLDTISSYDLGTQIDCVASGNCAVPDRYTLLGLRFLNVRDLASVALGTWALLLAGYLSLAIGACHTRYGFRQLQAGDHNRVAAMRTELRKRSKRPVGVAYGPDGDSML